MIEQKGFKRFILISLISTPVYADELAKKIDPASSGSLWQMSLSLLIVLGLILFLAYFYKRLSFSKNNTMNAFKIISTLGLGTKEKLVLVEVGSAQLLLGVTSQNIGLLHTLNEEEKSKILEKDEKSFARKLKEAIKKE